MASVLRQCIAAADYWTGESIMAVLFSEGSFMGDGGWWSACHQ